MGDAPRQNADGLQLSGPKQLVLHPFLTGDVPVHAHQPHRLAREVEQRHFDAIQNQPLLAGPGDLHHRVDHPSPGHHLAVALLVKGRQRPVKNFGIGPSQDQGSNHAVHLFKGGVDHQIPPLRILEVNGVRQRLDQGVEPSVQGFGFGLGALSLGDFAFQQPGPLLHPGLQRVIERHVFQGDADLPGQGRQSLLVGLGQGRATHRLLGLVAREQDVPLPVSDGKRKSRGDEVADLQRLLEVARDFRPVPSVDQHRPFRLDPGREKGVGQIVGHGGRCVSLGRHRRVNPLRPTINHRSIETHPSGQRPDRGPINSVPVPRGDQLVVKLLKKPKAPVPPASRHLLFQPKGVHPHQFCGDQFQLFAKEGVFLRQRRFPGRISGSRFLSHPVPRIPAKRRYSCENDFGPPPGRFRRNKKSRWAPRPVPRPRQGCPRPARCRRRDRPRGRSS